MNGAAPLWTVGWISAVILVPVGAVAAITTVQDRRRNRRTAARLLAALRFDPVIMSGPVDPRYDPAGAPPLEAEAARRRAITTLIATASRHLR